MVKSQHIQHTIIDEELQLFYVSSPQKELLLKFKGGLSDLHGVDLLP